MAFDRNYYQRFYYDPRTAVTTRMEVKHRARMIAAHADYVGLPVRRILDAGCGTGYLSAKLRDRGARVTGVDLAGRMVEIARSDHPGIDFRVDSCTELATLADGQFDLVIANYVLMDMPDLGAAVRAFQALCPKDAPSGQLSVRATGVTSGASAGQSPSVKVMPSGSVAAEVSGHDKTAMMAPLSSTTTSGGALSSTDVTPAPRAGEPGRGLP